MKHLVMGVALATAAVTLVGCGEDKGKVPEVEKPAVAEAPVQEETKLVPGQYYEGETGIFERRKSPASEYPTLIDFTSSYYDFDETHRAYADLYVSFAKDVADEVIVELIDPNYRNITDVFARKDKVAEMAGKVAEFKQQVGDKSTNVTVKTGESIEVSPYNMEKGAFLVKYKVPGEGRVMEWTKDHYDSGALSFGVTLLSGLFRTQPADAEFAVTVDEATARKVEGYLSSVRGSANSWVNLEYRAQGYVLDTFASSNNRKFGVVIMPERYELLHPETGEVLLTLDERHLAPKFRLVTGDVSSNVSSEISERYGLQNGRF